MYCDAGIIKAGMECIPKKSINAKLVTGAVFRILRG